VNRHGMNWIRQEKRLAIYLRDGLACVYCNEPMEYGAVMTLDHLVPRRDGGSNEQTNLVTCCIACNIRKGNDSVAQFVARLVSEVDPTASEKATVDRVAELSLRPMAKFLTLSRALMNGRNGSASNALKAILGTAGMDVVIEQELMGGHGAA
jgi:HNH endonuclease